MGILERGGKVRTQVIENRKGKALQPIVRGNVETGTEVDTDMHLGYWGLDADYTHQMVDHAVESVKGRVHTNGMENFWSLPKRTVGGTYVAVEPFHLHRCLDERIFRFNNRATKGNPLNDVDRFTDAMTQIVGRLLT